MKLVEEKPVLDVVIDSFQHAELIAAIVGMLSEWPEVMQMI